MVYSLCLDECCKNERISEGWGVGGLELLGGMALSCKVMDGVEEVRHRRGWVKLYSALLTVC